MKSNNSKQALLSLLGIIVLVIVLVGVSFAAFSYSKTGEKVNTITTGTISMSYTESENAIKLENVMPMTDAVGMNLADENQYFDFTVKANIVGKAIINYAITATIDPDSTISDSDIKVYLTDMDGNSDAEILPPTKVSALEKTGSSEISGAKEGQYILKTDTFNTTSSHSYRLRMWVDENYQVGSVSKGYKLRVNVYGSAAAQ